MEVTSLAPLLEGIEDYDVWARIVKHVLMDRGLWEVTEKGVITPEESLLTEPESSTAAELRSAVKNEEAFLIIFVHLSPKLRKVYIHDKDAKKLWGILRTRYTETTFAMASRLLNEMNKLTYDGSIETMFDKYLSIKRQIASAGISYENLFNLGMLNALPLELRHSYIDILNEMELGEPLNLTRITPQTLLKSHQLKSHQLKSHRSMNQQPKNQWCKNL
ncbi:hypothetical protein GGI21_002811 [Coemansia aciculifera]|nr:hypothetical protein GGI21_002811 [Coemansia aciculifera]